MLSIDKLQEKTRIFPRLFLLDSNVIVEGN